MSPVSTITYIIVIITTKLACSKRSDSGERCEVKKALKSRGGLYFLYYLPRYYFFALLLLRTSPHYLNAWNRLQPNALFFFFFQVISRHVELQGKSYPLEQQQQVIAYNTMFE